MAKRDPSRTISIHGDKYTYDSDKNKWMSGKKEATPATAAMLDIVLKQLEPESDEETNFSQSAVSIYPNGQGSDVGSRVPTSKPTKISTSSAVGNEPHKDSSFFNSPEKKDYIGGMVENIKSGKTLPPVMSTPHPADPSQNIVVDGNHRAFAHQEAGASHIPAVHVSHDDIHIASHDYEHPDQSFYPLSSFRETNGSYDMNKPRPQLGGKPLKHYFADKKPISGEQLDEESPEAVRDKEEAHERKQEAQEDMEDSPPPAESEAEVEQIKPKPLDPTSLKPPTPEAEPAAPEQIAPAPAPTPLERRVETLKDEYTERLRERLAKRMPLLRLFTDRLEDPKKAPQANRAEQVKPKPVEPDQLKPAAEPAKPVAPAAEQVVPEATPQPTLATEQAEQVKPKPVEADQLKPAEEQTDSDAPQAEAQPVKEQTPFERRFGRLKDEYTERFAERIRKRMPLARLFTDRLEDPKSAAKKESQSGDIPPTKVGAIGGLTKEATDALKSIDKSIKEILALFKDNKKEHKQEQLREQTEEQKEEIKTEAAKREKAVDDLEKRELEKPETMLKAPDAITSEKEKEEDATNETDSGGAVGGMGQDLKQYAADKIKTKLMSRGRKLFSNIKRKLGFGGGPAGKVAEVAEKEAKIAEEVTSTGSKRLRDKTTGRFVKQAAAKESMEVGEKVLAKESAETGGKVIAQEVTSTGSKRLRDKTTGRFVKQAVEKEGVEVGEKVLAKQEAKVAEKVLAKESAETGGKILAKQGIKAAEKVGVKTLAKTAGKSLLKKIPGVGLLAGLAFGAGRLMKGDVLGAVGEVGSGLASTIPGVGTAASVAIDAGLAARDIYKANKDEDAEKEPKEYADGGIVNNPKPLKLFADGGVVNSPTAFSHEGGTGVMGEAGPEAIMPLQKSADGKLGVKMQAEPVKKDGINPQTNALEQAEEQRKLSSKKDDQTAGKSPTIINNSTTNNNQSGGGGGGSIPTAGPRNSLDLNYYAQ